MISVRCVIRVRRLDLIALKSVIGFFLNIIYRQLRSPTNWFDCKYKY